MARRSRSQVARLPLVAAAVAVLLGVGIAPASAHGRDATVAPVARQLRGLKAVDVGPCAGGYRVTGTGFCSHGPDPRPVGRRPTFQPPTLAGVIEGPLPDAVICDGDGTSGKRVQAIYARTASIPSRRSTVVPQIRTAAAGVQSAFLASAARTDGVRRPRWVTDAECRLKVIEVVLSENARKSFNAMIAELGSLGLARSDRKYLVWFDTNVYCGIGTFWGDDRPTPDNLSNTRTGYGRVDAGCWGWAEPHELMHTLGAVQGSAPHTTAGVAPGAFAHCTDEYDVMCYPDAAGVTMTVVCPDHALDGQFDCGNDDYFDTDPVSGSYLGTHWNTADSGWLEPTVVQLVAPVPRLVTGATVGAQRIPVVVALASRAPLAGIESIDAQRRTASTGWQATGSASGSSIDSVLRPGATARFRARVRDGIGTPGPWRLGPSVTVHVHDDDRSSLRWSGAWRSVEDADARGGSLHRTRVAGATLTLSTDAAQVGILAPVGPSLGRLDVRVDGRRATLADLASPTTRSRALVVVVDLPSGRHSVTVRVLAPKTGATGWSVGIDAIVLLGH